ncbi:MAG: RnfABCDGE type electron transport complex subunit G [Rikenellaceae bacterium]|jgi:electron transport complex protein RnfG|nr:RnfABCDGE type electron transport complex subunit G [Rikenellaceae bacterium]
MESTLKNMVVVLLLITLVCSAAVGLVYKVTAEPIAAAKDAKISGAIALVVPTFDNNPAENPMTKEVDGGVMTVYTATQGGQVMGYAVETFTNEGFGGTIKLMVGFLPDGSISHIEVIEQKETPGLGDKIDKSKSDFSLQFEGKSPADFKLSVRKDGGDVDAITASTISSRAYCDAVERAYNLLQTIKR